MKNIMKLKLIIAASVLTSSAVLAYGEHTDPALQKLAQAFAEAARNHDKVSAAYGLAEEITKDRPTDPIALVYQGSLATQVARDAFLPWKKLAYLKDGMDMMDRALDLTSRAPSDPAVVLEVLMVRALSNVRIPTIFGRGAMARSDLNRILSNPVFKDLKAKDQASVYAWLAVYAHRDGQVEKAESHLQKAVATERETADSIWSGK